MPIITPESADFTPSRGQYTTLRPFRFWCQKVLPAVYDDSLSYYELLTKVIDYLNKTMEDVETSIDDVDNLRTAYGELQDYVNDNLESYAETYNDFEERVGENVGHMMDAFEALNNFVNSYFENLDVQEEIDNKLDEMALDGSLNRIVSPIIQEDLTTSVPIAVAAWLNANVEPTQPLVDYTLSIAEAASESSTVGANFEADRAMIDVLNKTVGYGYTPQSLEADPDASALQNKVGVKRNGTMVTLDGSSDDTYVTRVRVSGELVRVASSSAAEAWDSGVAVESGHKYKVSAKLVDGSAANTGSQYPRLEVYAVGSSTDIGAERTYDTYDYQECEFTGGSDAINLCWYIYPNTTYVDAQYQILLQDVTDPYATASGVLDLIDSKIDPTLSESGQAAQAKAVGDEIGELRNELRDIALFGEYNVLPEMTWTRGSYLSNNGSISSSGTSYLSDYLDITAFEKLYMKNNSTHVYRLAQYDSNKTYIANTYVNVSSNGNALINIDENAKYILVSIGDWSTLYTEDELLETVELNGNNMVSDTNTLAKKNSADILAIQSSLSSDNFEYVTPIDITVNTGCFSKIGWSFYTASWAENYRYAQLSVSAGDKYIASGFGNANAQFVMFFSGEPSEANYISGIGTGNDGESYTNYEVTVPANAVTMLVQSRELPDIPKVSVCKEIKYTLAKSLEGKMYWEIKDGELTVVSKYTSESDLVVKFGKRGPNSLPDFKTFSIAENEESVVGDGSNAVQFIGDVTDWHSPFQVSAQSNGDGDNPTSNYYTGGNHNYNNQGVSGEGLATARNIYLKYIIDGIETECGSGYSNNIKAIWQNNVQGYNTTKSDGSGREILSETHELLFNNLKFQSDGFIEPLEDVYITSYYGYQLFGLGVSGAFDSGLAFIGAANRGVFEDLSVGHNSGNALCDGLIAIGDDNNCKLTVDVAYDLGRRTFYVGDNGCFSTQYAKAYTNLIALLSASAGNRYYSRATWEFYPTINA